MKLILLLLCWLGCSTPFFINKFPSFDFTKDNDFAKEYDDLLKQIDSDISKFVDSHNHKGSYDRLACNEGHYFNENTKTCERCLPGYYSKGGLNVSCLPCPVGQFSDISGAVQCQICLAGHYSRMMGASACTPCTKGTYKNITGPGNCTLCPNSRTYTTLWEGATSVDDCIGPLAEIRDKVSGITTQVRDNTRITWNHNIELLASSGDWVFRNPAAPNYFYQAINLAQGSSSNTIWNLPTGWLIIEPVMVNKFCYIDVEGHGRYFSGPHDRDHRGRKCKQPCRNPDSQSMGPYCEITDETGNSINSTCGIPKCIWDVECSAHNGEGYRGNASSAAVSTFFGDMRFDCQTWDTNFPHPHIFHPSKLMETRYGIVSKSNYCRNPAPEAHTEPWCYTTSIWARAVPCNVKRCDDSIDYFKKYY